MTRVQLQIQQPCAQSWDAMPPSGQGRHCAACQQVVNDFSYRTDAEVLALVREAAGSRVCGRFRPEQLGRVLTPPQALGRWRAWLLTATLWAGRSLAPTHSQDFRSHNGGPVPAGSVADYQNAPPASSAAGAKAAKLTPSPSMPAGSLATAPINDDTPATATGPMRIRGRVLDKTTQERLPGATVLLAGTDIGVTTAADGTSELTVLVAKGNLWVSSVGYLPQKIRLTNSHQPLCLLLELDTRVLGGLLVTYPWYSPRRWWDWARSVPQRLSQR